MTVIKRKISKRDLEKILLKNFQNKLYKRVYDGTYKNKREIITFYYVNDEQIGWWSAGECSMKSSMKIEFFLL